MIDLIDPPLTIPAGTQVVARAAVRDAADAKIAPAGAVGVIVTVPEQVEQPYLVRLPDGREVVLHRDDLRIRKAHQREGGRAPSRWCVAGSRAFGLDDAHFDTDRRRFYLSPAHLHWSLAGLPE